MGVTAIYSGTFDPLTNGHANIVQRAARMYDRVVVAVAISTLKNTMFTIDERISLANQVLGENRNVEAVPFDGLIVDFAQAMNATVILRGVGGMLLLWLPAWYRWPPALTRAALYASPQHSAVLRALNLLMAGCPATVWSLSRRRLIRLVQ